MAQMVDAKLHFKALGSLLTWDRHNAGVVDQKVQPLPVPVERLGTGLYRP